VLCRIPSWQFDLPALEDLHCQLEELRADHEDLKIRYGRAQDVLVSLNANIEAAEATEVAQRQSMDHRHAGTREAGQQRETLQLRQQLVQSEKKQQETKATVIALRSEFMQLVDMMSDGSGSHGSSHRHDDMEPPWSRKGPGRPLPHVPYMVYEADHGDCSEPLRATARMQAAGATGGRRPGVSPRPQYSACNSSLGTPRLGGRPRAGMHKRGHVHSVPVGQRNFERRAGW
jgi:hypothetical protein